MSEVVSDGAELWNRLQDDAGLQPDGWDAPLTERLRKLLNLDDGPIETELSDRNIGSNLLIRRFLEAAEPYVQMWDDLLALFETANATTGDNRLSIEYDFGGGDPPTRIDLEHFRQARTAITRGLARFDLRSVHHNALWSALETVQSTGLSAGLERDIETWCQEYWTDQPWPSMPRRPTRFPAPEVERLVEECWALAEFVLAEVVEVSSSRPQLRSKRDSHELTAAGTPARLLSALENDMWVGNLVHALHSLPFEPEDSWISATDSALDRLRNYDPKYGASRELLEEFLELPVWKQRHELFSNWVAATVIDGLADLAPRIHVSTDGVIRFAFSGCHLATFDATSPRVHLMTELRSPLDAPVGKNRKRAIQPDISFVLDPITDIGGCPIAIECKQYAKPDYQVFANALTDYARGRPSAAVILVDHGRVNADLVLNKVKDDVVHRCAVVSDLSPDKPSALATFHNLVRTRLGLSPMPYGTTSDPAECLDQSESAVFTLRWATSPRDLDLHLEITERDGSNHKIGYASKGDANRHPFVELDKDDQEGHGEETIEIRKWLPGARYEFRVNRYSSEGVLSDAEASVEVTAGGASFTMTCPTGVEKDWLCMTYLRRANGG